MADEDDLYADLYTEDIGNTSTGSAGAAQPGEGAEQDDATRGNLTSNGTGSGGGRSSFIPPAPAPAISMPSGSFIPPAPAKTGGSGGSFIPPPTSTTPAAAATLNTPPQARASSIDTAPSTNTDERRAMGSTSGSAAAAGASGSAYTSDKPILPHEMPDEGKLFVGGLNWDTTDAGLKQYFSQFGKVDHCLIMRDPSTSRSRGFAFLTFADPKAVNSVMVKEHYLDGKMIDPKRAIPRQENVRTAKCFVGGVPSTATSESFRAFFAQYGNVLDSTLMMDRETQKPRGYGFVTYDNDATVERLLQIDALAMDGKMIEVKRATPRNNDGSRKVTGQRDGSTMRSGGDGMAGSTSVTSGSNTSNNTADGFGMAAANPMAAMMMNNSMFSGASNNQQFDPNAMAQFFQQQQQQSGGAFNPLMLQQMMMGAGGGMGGMSGWGGGGNHWMNAMSAMSGMGGMGSMGGFGGMGGMGGMGFGGMGGVATPMSPPMAQGTPRAAQPQQQQSGSASSHAAGMRNSPAASSPGGGMRAGATERDARSTSRPAGLPSRPAGLPSRPSDSVVATASSSTPSTSAARASPATGRDYQRERSPERGAARSGSSSRW